MAEKKKGKKGKKGGMAILTAILVPILIVVMVASIFFTIVEAIIDIISNVVRSIITNIASFLSNPIKFVSSKWGAFTNWWEKQGIGNGDFDEAQYEDARGDLEAAVVVSDEDFNNMKAALDGKISQSATGLDDIMLKKMLLAYYRGLYLTDTNILMEITDDEANLDKDEFKPFEVVKGDTDNGRGEDGKKYLQAKGMVTITTDGESLIYYPLETLKEIYQKHYVDVVDDNEEYAESVLDYLEKCYTYSSTGLQIYATVKDKKTETWKYENEGTKKTLVRNSSTNVTLTNIEFYEKISQYVTPVEFMVDLMEVTGSKDFVNAFIETVGTETGIKMELEKITYEEETEEVEKRNRATTVTGEKGNDYTYCVKKADGTILPHTVEEIDGTNEINIKVDSSGTDCRVTLYVNNVPETENKQWKEGNVTHTTTVNKTYDLNKDNNWTKTWSNKTKSDKTSKEKQDTSKVIHTITTTHKETKYDLAITEVETWYAKITQDNNKNTRTMYSSILEDGNEVSIADENGAIEIAKEDENNEYTSTTHPKIFIKKDYDSVTDSTIFSMEDCLNSEYNYIINLVESGYNPSDYTFTKMVSNDTQITKSTLKKTTIKTLEKGIQKAVDNTDLFLGLLSNEDGKYKVGAKFKAKSAEGKVVKYPDLYGNATKKSNVGAGELLINGAEMFFLLLEESKNTQGLSDVMRYILYRYSGIDYGVTSLNFNMFASNFISVGASGVGLLKEYIHTWENAGGAPTNADGTKYIIHDDGKGHPTVGYGIDIFNGGYAPLFEQAGYPTYIGGEVDIEFVDSLEEQEITSCLNQIRSITSGLDLTEYQIHALVSRAYNCGVAGATGIRNGKTFVQAYTDYWNQEIDDLFEEKNSVANFSHQLYTQYMNKPVTSGGDYLPGLERRRKSEWTLFQTGYYNVINQWYSEGAKIIEVADRIHKYMEENNYTYCVYYTNSYEECDDFGLSCGLNSSFEASKTGHKKTCCATYVSWVLQEVGYITNAEHTNGANAMKDLLLRKGWTKIYSISELKPGDVIYYSYGHVEIYAGDGLVYNAGCGSAIRGASPGGGSVKSMTYGLRAPDL